MRKSTLFVSAMLTVFLMATMFGVVSAYQQVVKNNDIASVQQPAPQKVLSQPVNVELASAPTEAQLAVPVVVTAEEATTIAVEFLGDTSVFSVEVVDYQGVPTYLVTFSSGDLVYVSSAGVVVANEKLQPVYVASNSGNGGGNTGKNNGKNNGGDSSDDGGNGGGESHEEHEDDDD